MSSGFNTDVKVGEHVFHVQTEDRGPSHPIIDTAVYQSGRILHRRALNYTELSESPLFTPDDLRRRVEEQHRAVIDDIRSGRTRFRNRFRFFPTASQSSRRNSAPASKSRLLVVSRKSFSGSGSLAPRRPPATSRSERRSADRRSAKRFSPLRRPVTIKAGSAFNFRSRRLGKVTWRSSFTPKRMSWKDELRFIMRSRPKESPASSATPAP